MQAKKAKVTLGNVALSAKAGVVWKFVGGTRPFQTVMSVHKSKWPILESQLGEPLNLKIVDSRGVETSINQVYILHLAPSDHPSRVSFVVSDKRWKWASKLVVRDFNMPRKTGDRTALNAVPVQTQTVVDVYDYLGYSLRGDQEGKWTAKEAVEEVLEVLEGEGTASGGYKIESFPIKDTTGSGTAGEFTIQGVTLRDQGDVALARMLSYVPGAEVFINNLGQAIVFDATDIDATRQHFNDIPVSTYSGEHAVWVDRKHVRPSKINVFYQREVELFLEFEDDYSGGTSAQPVRNRPYIENVCPTVDAFTEIQGEYDPEINQTPTKRVPPGTWVRFDKLLEAWDRERPEGSWPWTFKTIKEHWVKGNLEGALGAQGKDVDNNANIALRVQAIRTHFRQSFRINSRYMSRVRSLRAVRVGMLDPVTGARAPAAVWGQACMIPNTKGEQMASRGTEETAKLKVYRNIDMLRESQNQGTQIIETPHGPTRVNIVDEALGVFRLEWVGPASGEAGSFIPCKLVNDQNFDGIVPTRDLMAQDDLPMGIGLNVQGGTNGIWLDDSLEYAVVLTVVPAAPNSELQFHKETVEASDIQDLFRREFGITEGEGPELNVYVPPGEVTARFALNNQNTGAASLGQLFGLDGAANTAGIEGPEIPGYTLTNGEREIKPHATSLGAEILAQFADNVQGTVVTRVPDGGVKLVGNMAGAAVRVAAAPSAKVDAVHQFPGQQRAISRLAVMPESARQLILGTVVFES